MPRIIVVLCVVVTATLAAAQTTVPTPAKEPPQSPRQALIEAFFGQAPNHLEKHLPEITRKAFRQLDTGTGSSTFLTEIASAGQQAKSGMPIFELLDTGPLLLSAENPGIRQKVEIVVERDDLMGDEDQIELSLHLYKNGQEERWPVIPRLTFAMKTEADVWRIYDLNLSVRAPIGDPDFLKTLVGTLLEKQQNFNEMAASMSLRSIANAEATYKANTPSGGFTCSLAKLAEGGTKKDGEYPGLPRSMMSWRPERRTAMYLL